MTSIVRGVHPPEAMMHFPPVSDFPLFSKTISDSLENFPFPVNFFDFHPPKFLMIFFLVINHKFRISPLFLPFISIYFPLLFKISTLFSLNLHWFFTYFMCFSFPLFWPWCIYASHNFEFPPYFRHLFQYISPYFTKNNSFPLLFKISPCFR